jgi:hypothetical protein
VNAQFYKKNLVAGLAAMFSIIFSAAVSHAGAAPGKTPAASGGSVSDALPYFSRSTFTWPDNKQQGRDPFYPKSEYPFQRAKPATPQTPVPVAPQTVDLKLSGISGTPEHRLCIINNKTFEQGEEREVPVGSSRINIHVVKIEADMVTVQVGTQVQVLHLRRNF